MGTILLADIRYALRTLLGSPGFTAAAVLSLAIGIGANTAIFSVASALRLHSLPYADADRLAILWNRSPGLGITEDWFSTAQYFDIKTGHSGFEQVAIAIGGNDNLTGDGEPERVGTIRVSANLLPMLGAKPQLVTIGLAGAFALTRFMDSLLFEVRAVDALTFTVIPALLVAIALVASYVPARRAARIDPTVSLRSE